jgi:hypothetical protein
MNRNRLQLAAVLLLALATVVGVHPTAEAAEPDGGKLNLDGVWLPVGKASRLWPAERPFTKEMAARRAEWTRRTAPIDLTRDDEHISCLPYTLANMMITVTQYPIEVFTTPRRVYVLTETFGQVRRIELGASPVSADTLPSRTGVSRGRWEGDKLVVETTHILPEHEGARNPSSSQLRFQERFSLEDAGAAGLHLINEITIADPLVYTQPIQLRMAYKRAAPGVGIGEYVCNEDLWDQQRDGATSVIPWR